MSVLFGIWNQDGRPVDPEVIRVAGTLLNPYAPDGVGHYCGIGITLSQYALHTNPESRQEKQPYVSRCAAVITFDGRLDNRDELIRELGGTLTNASPDVEIVAASFDQWSTRCFAKLLGDWAVGIWNESDRTLVLAKDFAGIRPLYYFAENDRIQWSSALDPLIRLSGRKFHLNQEYVAGWLGMYSATSVTPFVGIHSVPASSFVTITEQKQIVVKYWDFDPDKRIVYRIDADYEEHFRTTFREAVRRRLRSDHPICAELSGGMDSNSITCMASLIAGSSSDIAEIHTLSFYDDSEPHADERTYFTKAERNLGRTGCHIDLADVDMFRFDEDGRFVAFPGSMSGRPKDFTNQQSQFLESRNIRVVLSGIGGDEMMGGVPSPEPELQDLLVQFEIGELAHKLKLWALSKRKPWFYLFGNAIRGFLPPSIGGQPKHLRPASWIQKRFVHRYRDVLTGFSRRVRLRGPLPSLQTNLDSLETVRRQLGSSALPSEPARETRYPFLDRTLLEFIFAIPREQVLLPGYRRSLMRRALAGIVPAEILERRRKAYVTRGPRVAISKEWERLSCLSHNMISGQLGIVDEGMFHNALIAIPNSDQIPLPPLARVIVLEAWLRLLVSQGVLIEPQTITANRNIVSLAVNKPSTAS